MGSEQFNTRIEPNLRDRYNGFMDQYKKDGRISKKGDFFGICLDDHLEMEKWRIFMEYSDPITKEGLDYLERLFEVFKRSQVHHNNEISMLTRKFNDELLAKEIRINNLEQKIAYLKEQLQEKIVENGDLKKDIESLQKGLERLRKNENKKSATG